MFREHGYEGASLTRLGSASGLGKGSLYHFFPGGKDEMAEAVLAEIDGWFEANVFALLETGGADGISAMFDAVETYFHSGRRVCLVGAFALCDTRDRFRGAIAGYFARWTDALEGALARTGNADATGLAEEIVGGIQGALVLARAADDPAIFSRTLERLRVRAQDM
ncbi:TetR/AcrR family transcriptional regulator [Breoghania sp. L-A4]|nr:TetR/AcrR family transcriptional regulator [Breoghania sp. L-A4]